ncbi:hypothetical protein Y5S_01560 [Alcanivorax nanhaiticus]|uniref:Collagen-like protein n=1 Tax=Alcanivorax nanhaiticus TaxID=1177154 RepID=A0A095SKG5_9GAMM|nr:collagen-like protein [Alcanivorax nanhaiticus]KGD65126.1 hypothetical protein Y5S_01560 [Alcanivorax nanhaiticus]
MRLHRVLWGLLLGTLASTPVLAGEDHYQELLNTYHELVALRESPDQTALIQGAQGPQGPQGEPGDPGPVGVKGDQGPVGGTSLSETDRDYVNNSLDWLYTQLPLTEQWLSGVQERFNNTDARYQKALSLSDTLQAEVTSVEGGAGL